MSFLLGQDGNFLLGPDQFYLTDGGIDIPNLDLVSTLDIQQTIISQYANSPVLLELIQGFRDASDQTENLNSFYQNVWNIDTATGYGLEVWGRIVGVERSLTIPPKGDFGFREGDGVPFGSGPFYSSILNTENYLLPDDAYRQLILIKAASNIGACTTPAINTLLAQLFPGRGRCYVQDLGYMQMSYVFEFALTPVELAILTQSGALPRPSGVQISIQQIIPAERFGFSEGSWAPFGSGDFAGDAVNAIY